MAAHRGGSFLWPFSLVSRQLKEMGHDVVVLTTAHPDGKTTTTWEDGVQVYYLKGTKAEKTDGKYWQASARLFDTLHGSHRFDLVMGRGRSSWGYVGESRFAGKVPLVSHEGTYPSWLHSYKVKPISLTDPLKWAHALANATANRKLAACLMQSDLVIGNSHALADAIAECFWWAPPATRFIPYSFPVQNSGSDPVDTPLCDDLRDWCMKGDYLVYVGRVTRKKGALDLLRVLHACRDKDLRLLICGSTNNANERRVKQLAGELGVAHRIHLAGPVAHVSLPAIHSNAKAFLFPSTHPESLPKSVMEAMAAGLPVLGYDIPAMRELLCNGKEGFLARPGDLAAFTAALNRILDDEALRKQLGTAARKRIESGFHPQRIAQMWEDALQTYVGDKQRVAPTFYGFAAGEPA